MNEKKIKVYSQVGNFVSAVYVTVPQDVWDEEVDGLEEAVRDDIANCDDDEDFEQNLADEPYYGGYIGSSDGCSHGYTSAHGRIAYHLVSCQYGSILAGLGVLEQLRDAIVKDLVESDTEHQHEEELLSGTAIHLSCWMNWPKGYMAFHKRRQLFIFTAMGPAAKAIQLNIWLR